jgi:drug/metabolite transporter (DMT)-like permease
MLLSALGFSVMTLSVKLLGERIPTLQIVFVRGVFTVVVTGALLRWEGVSPWGNRRGALVLRGLFGVVALACFYAATMRLPLAEVTVLHYTNPIFTALLAALVLRERIGARLLVGLLAGFAGVAALAGPAVLGRGGTIRPADLPWMGVALLSAVLAALAYITVRDLRRTEHPLVVVFWFALVMIPVSVVPSVVAWVPPTPKEWGTLLLVAVSAQFGQVYLTHGLSALPAARAMTIGYVQVAFAVLWGGVVFGDIPDAASVVGIALIVVGAVLANAGTFGRPSGK